MHAVCDGSAMRRWLRLWISGMALISNRGRCRAANVRIPDSQRITFPFPCTRTYSAASRTPRCGAHPAAQDDWPLRTADLAQQAEVLHVAAADLQNVRELDRGRDLARLHHLDADRQVAVMGDLA